MKSIKNISMVLTLALALAACGSTPAPAPVDTTKPTVGTPEATVKSDYSVTIKIAATDDSGISKITYSIDGGAAVNFTLTGSSPYTLTIPASAGLTPGAHTITINVYDKDGNVTTSTVQVTVSDYSVPTIGGVTTAPAANNTYGVTAVINATDNVGISKIVYSVDDGAPVEQVVTGKAPYTLNIPAQSVGTHTLHVTAYDASGNASTTVNTTFVVVDANAPVISAAVPVQDADAYTVTAQVTATDNVSVNRLSYHVDNEAAVSVNVSGAAPYTLHLPAQTIGTHTLHVTAYDSENLASAEFTVSFGVSDVTNPAISTFTVQQGELQEGGYHVQASVTATDNVSVASLSYKLDNAAEVAMDVTGDAPYMLDLGALSVGTHSLTVTARDAAGNASTVSTQTFAVADVTKPAAPVVTLAQDSGAYTLSASIAATDNVGVVKVVYSLDDAAEVTLDGSGPFEVALPIQSVGTHTLHVTAYDAAGNTSSTDTSVNVVDIAVPTVQDVSVNQAINGYGVMATVEATDDVAVTELSYSLDGGDYTTPAAVTGNSPFTLDLGTQSVGNHTLNFKAYDAAGNISAAFTKTFTVADVTAPTISAVDATQGAVSGSGYTVSASVTAADNIGVTKLSYSLDGATYTTPAAVTGNSPFTLNLGTQSVGNHTLNFKAYDAAGNISAAFTKTFTVADVTAPTISAVDATQGAVSGSGYTVSASVTAADNIGVTKLSYSLDGATYTTPAAVTGNSPFTLNLGTQSVGNHTLNFKAYDAAGNISAVFTKTFTVADVTAPTISAVSATQGAVSGSGYTVSASVTAADNIGVTKLSYSLDGATYTTPAAVTGNSPFTLSIPNVASGTHTVTVKAYDAANNIATSTTVTFTVIDTIKPTLSGQSISPNGQSGTSTVSVTATDNVGVTRVSVSYTDATTSTVKSIDLTAPTTGNVWSTNTIKVKSPSVLTLTAYDAAGNTQTATLNNP